MQPSDSHPDGSLVWGTSLDSTALREGISKAQEAWESDRLVFLGEYVETGRKPDTIGCSWWWCCGLTQANANLSDHVEIQVPKRGFQLQMKFSNFSQVVFWQSYLGQSIEAANYTPAKVNDSSNCFHFLRMFGCIYLTCFFLNSWLQKRSMWLSLERVYILPFAACFSGKQPPKKHSVVSTLDSWDIQVSFVGPTSF